MIKCGSHYVLGNAGSLNIPKHIGRRLSNGQDTLSHRPVITIATICRENQATLRRCIESVLDQAAQCLPGEVEYILVDGDSGDSSWEIICEYQSRIEYAVSEKDNGIYDALNKALELSRGEYICFIHGDDFLCHAALRDAISYLNNCSPDIHVGSAIYFGPDNAYNAYKPSRLYGLETIFKGITGPHESAFVKSALYSQLGGYDLSYPISADFKLLRDAILLGARQTCSEKVYSLKLAGGSSFNEQSVDREQIRLLNELFPRIDCHELYNVTVSLRSHNTLSRESISLIYRFLQENSKIPSVLLHSLSQSLCRSILGDSNTSTVIPAVIGTGENKTPRSNKPSVMLCVWRLHDVSGGAEKVLVQVANHLSLQGHKVIISSADYHVGSPFYSLSSDVELVTHGEFNLRQKVPSDKYIQWLEKSILEVIDRLPDDVLYAALMDRESRICYQKWTDLTPSDLDESKPKKEVFRELLRQDVAAWLRLYSKNTLIWRRQFELYQPNIVVPFMISTIPQVSLACKGLNVKLLTSNHNNPKRDYFQQDTWCSQPLDRALRFYGILSARNHWLLKEYVKILPPSCRKKAVVIGNPIEPVSIEVRKNWSLSNRFIAVGRLTEAKDFSFLISCYKLYRNQGGRKELDIFGTGPLSDSLAQQIDFEGLGRYLKIRQPVRDISSEYINSSIFLSSSLVEGFPLTLCEAMQHGLPCIGRGLCSGVNSLISHNLSGLLSSAESVELEKENYASLMILAERDPMLLDRLRENALLKLLEYSSENVLGQWEDFINSSSL